MTENLTISEAIADNLIALVNAADGVDPRSFAQLLESAARVHIRAAELQEWFPQVALATQPKDCGALGEPKLYLGAAGMRPSSDVTTPAIVGNV